MNYWLVVSRWQNKDGEWVTVYREFSDLESANIYAEQMYACDAKEMSVSIFQQIKVMC